MAVRFDGDVRQGNKKKFGMSPIVNQRSSSQAQAQTQQRQIHAHTWAWARKKRAKKSMVRDDELAARRAWPFLIRDHPPNRAQGCGDAGRWTDWLTDSKMRAGGLHVQLRVGLKKSGQRGGGQGIQRRAGPGWTEPVTWRAVEEAKLEGLRSIQYWSFTYCSSTRYIQKERADFRRRLGVPSFPRMQRAGSAKGPRRRRRRSGKIRNDAQFSRCFGKKKNQTLGMRGMRGAVTFTSELTKPFGAMPIFPRKTRMTRVRVGP